MKPPKGPQADPVHPLRSDARIGRRPAEDVERRVLIVEDERIVALDLQVTLESLGYVVVGAASSSEQALRCAEETEPHVVLMDVRLKGNVDGVQTAGLLRARYPVVIVFLTANADPTTLGSGLAAEPSGYVTKPYSPSVLRGAVEEAFRKRAALLSAKVESVAGSERRGGDADGQGMLPG